ncbi:MAG TPA: hypothetical protein VM864_00160 [Pyrinomonadaceae bacterium]|jgi:hypothetical protein|nr:hypothetical protein [Pyrinomonadaceae bacterium]
MNFPRRTFAPLLALSLSVSLAFAQRPKPAPPQTAAAKPATDQSAPDVTLDTLFAADSYAIYGEMRGVGQYVSSEEFKQMLGPLRLPGTVPPEITQLLDFVTSHAETLADARLAFGAMAARDDLPNVVAAVELSSVEAAQKLEPQLREFVADYYGGQSGDEGAAAETTAAGAAKRSATPTPAAVVAGSRAGRRRARLQSQSQSPRTLRAGERVEAQAVAPVFIRRAGSLVVMADRQFTFRRLRGAAGAPGLLDEPGFQAARSRLSSDTLFLYFNTTRMSRSTKRQMDEYERRRKLDEAAEAKAKAAAPQTNPTLSTPDDRPIPYGDPKTNSDAAATNTNAGVSAAALNSNRNSNDAPATVELSPEKKAEMDAELAALEGYKLREAEEEEKRKSQPGYAEEQKRQERQREFERQFQRLVFNDSAAGGTWAESIGVGASIQGDEIVLRSLFVNDAEDRTPRPVPFMPILLSGPQVAPEAASVVPADADIFVAASLDLPQMYDYVASVFKIFDLAASAAGEQDKQGLFESQMSAFEKDNKFRIREDLLSALGNEIALVMPSDLLGVRRQRKTPKDAGADAAGADAPKQEPPTFAASPVVIISLADKRAVQELLPRALEAVGIRGVSEQQLIEKRGDVEVLTFTQASAAFVGNFLVMSDPQTMRWVIDAYNRRETLANSDEFRRAAGWQQRQLLGQVYVSNALLKDSFGDVYRSIDDLDDQELRGFLARLDPNPGAVTHTLTQEGNGLLHELHVPKNLLSLMSASAVVAQQLAPLRRNEAMATYAMYNVAQMQNEYKTGKGRFATLDELFKERGAEQAGEVGNPFEVEGYDIKVTASGDKFEATATPNNYPKSGRRSFFIDETNLLRGADTGGKTATASTELLNR